jgi:hypothetical protein
MELSREIIIDVLLNVTGYLTAGALWLVLYSLATGRNRAVAPATPKAKSLPVEPEPRESRFARKSEFVSFASAATTRDPDLEERDRLRSAATLYQRNRAEVIRIAREMLKSGTSQDNIRNLLPISEGELALLSNE